jgi:hypothetical protein
MKKNNLVPNKGLSLSQAQSISNLCNQRAIKISNELTQVNNFKKTIKVGDSEKTLKTGVKLPTDVVSKLKEVAELHACQAFLMENIKAKDLLLKNVRSEIADISNIEMPKRPTFENYQPMPQVNENFGWEQLSTTELNEYMEAEAFAAHIGQFIHKDGHLSRLRDELPNVPEIDWMELKVGEKTPIEITVHHTPDELLKVHEELAGLHRQYEQRVNYFKAKVKNLATAENARIAKVNADKQANIDEINSNLRIDYDSEMKKYNEVVRGVNNEFEKTRQDAISTIASMRIEVDSRFQKTIDLFLNELNKNDNTDDIEN